MRGDGRRLCFCGDLPEGAAKQQKVRLVNLPPPWVNEDDRQPDTVRKRRLIPAFITMEGARSVLSIAGFRGNGMTH